MTKGIVLFWTVQIRVPVFWVQAPSEPKWLRPSRSLTARIPSEEFVAVKFDITSLDPGKRDTDVENVTVSVFQALADATDCPIWYWIKELIARQYSGPCVTVMARGSNNSAAVLPIALMFGTTPFPDGGFERTKERMYVVKEINELENWTLITIVPVPWSHSAVETNIALAFLSTICTLPEAWLVLTNPDIVILALEVAVEINDTVACRVMVR